MTPVTRHWLTVFFQIVTRQSAPKVTPVSGQNASTALWEDNESLKRHLCEAEKILAQSEESLEELQTKHRKLLHSNGSVKERQLRQEILALETLVRYWPTPDQGRITPANGRSVKYSRNLTDQIAEVVQLQWRRPSGSCMSSQVHR